MKRLIKKIMIGLLVVVLVITAVIYAFMQRPMFGRKPEGARLERIKKSPNFRDGAFQNQSFTPDLAEGETYYSVMKEFLFGNHPRKIPVGKIPTQKIDLLHLSKEEDVLVWFGHSSYFMKLDGKTILVDPVFSGAASPISYTTPAFAGTDVCVADDLPEIDYLFISHDHWDHLDYETVMKLKPKVKKVITGLGTGEHLEYWGYNPAIIEERDWNEKVDLGDGFSAVVTPGRHFSGRTFKRNQALWVSFVFQTPSSRIFIGGDSGYDKHFKAIGDQYGPFDLAILENGQYNKSWKYIHMMPEEVLQAAGELKAKRLFPVHSSKFALANHCWDTPLKTITDLNKAVGQPLITPIIGEKVRLKDSTQHFSNWWEGIE